MVGLWIPDADESIQLDSRYSVRVANRDAPWWTTVDGKYGVNILETVKKMELKLLKLLFCCPSEKLMVP